MKTKILELLPYSQKVLLNKPYQKISILALLNNIALDAIEALNAFLENDLIKFDAQVGETCCQIRAHKVLEMSIVENKQLYSKALDRLLKYQKSINEAYVNLKSLNANRNPHFDRSLDKKEYIIDFINRLDLNFYISFDILFLITSYLLCKFSKRDNLNIPYAVDYQKFALEYKASNSASRRFLHNLQRINSCISTQYIFNLIDFLYPQIRSFADKLLRIGDRGRQVLPCFLLTRAILDDIKKKKRIIKFVIRNKQNNKFHLYYDYKRLCWYSSDKELQEKNKQVIYFKGYTDSNVYNIHEIMNLFKTFDPYNIILSNMAMHPQYTGTKLNNFIDSPFKDLEAKDIEAELIREFYEMRKFSKIHGTCITNKSLFFIEHIHCDYTSIKGNEFMKIVEAA